MLSKRCGLDNQVLQDNLRSWMAQSDSWPEMTAPSSRRKLVLLIPHPDDEVFGCSKVLQEWTLEAAETLVVYVTSGEAAYGTHDGDEMATLARLRRMESKSALQTLAPGGNIKTIDLNIPDSSVEAFEDTLADSLRAMIDENSIVLAPYYEDGHTDHNAIGRVAKALSEEIGFDVHFYPIWLWFWREKPPALELNFHRLPLSSHEQEAKRQAIECFASQIHTYQGHAAVLPEVFLNHYRSTSFEVLVH